jgi:hypothetical protein
VVSSIFDLNNIVLLVMYMAQSTAILFVVLLFCCCRGGFAHFLSLTVGTVAICCNWILFRRSLSMARVTVDQAMFNNYGDIVGVKPDPNNDRVVVNVDNDLL